MMLATHYPVGRQRPVRIRLAAQYPCGTEVQLVDCCADSGQLLPSEWLWTVVGTGWDDAGQACLHVECLGIQLMVYPVAVRVAVPALPHQDVPDHQRDGVPHPVDDIPTGRIDVDTGEMV